MSKIAYVSAGSSTRVKDGTGTLFGIWLEPFVGSSLILADNPDLGSAGPDFNSVASVTSTIGLHGPWPANPVPVFLDAHALRFSNALTVSATSSARVSIFFD